MSKNLRFRKLKIVIGIIAITGLITVFAYGFVNYLDTHNIDFESEINVSTDNTKEVKATEIKGVSFSEDAKTEGGLYNFIKGIDSSFTPNTIGDKAYLKVVTDNFVNIVSLNKNDTFEIIHSLPTNTKLVKLYDNEAVSFISKEPNFGTESLILKNKGDSSFSYINLASGSIVEDYLLDKETNSFYMILKFINGNREIHSSIGKDKLIAIYQGVSLTDKMYLVNSDKENIYLRDSLKCYKLVLKTKKIVDFSCTTIRQNDIGTNIDFDSDLLTLYSADGTFEYKITNKLLRTYSMVYASPYIYINFYDIKSPTKNSIQKLDIQKSKIETVIEDLGFINTTFFVFNDNMYLVAYNQSSELSIFKYKQSPVSFPNSFTTTDRFLNWQELKLPIKNKILSIERFYQNYFI